MEKNEPSSFTSTSSETSSARIERPSSAWRDVVRKSAAKSWDEKTTKGLVSGMRMGHESVSFKNYIILVFPSSRTTVRFVKLEYIYLGLIRIYPSLSLHSHSASFYLTYPLRPHSNLRPSPYLCIHHEVHHRLCCRCHGCRRTSTVSPSPLGPRQEALVRGKLSALVSVNAWSQRAMRGHRGILRNP